MDILKEEQLAMLDKIYADNITNMCVILWKILLNFLEFSLLGSTLVAILHSGKVKHQEVNKDARTWRF